MPKRKKGFYSVAEIDASPQLAAELLEFGNECVGIDEQIQILREQKANLFERMRDSSFDPAHARAWSAEKLKDEEKEAAKREKRTEAELIVETLAETETAKGRARARARNEAKAAGQEKFDAETGELLGDAPAPSERAVATVRIGDGPEISLEDFKAAAEAVDTPEGKAAVEAARDPETGIVSPTKALGAIIAARHPTPRTPPSAPAAPAPAAPAEPQHELIADQAARQANARALLARVGQGAEAAE